MRNKFEFWDGLNEKIKKIGEILDHFCYELCFMP